ncbi:helix-turn-helix domain protein [Bacillus cereus NVH0597-99]|nr:helix-turn-helix domain protein [Bacillus cereus NVH0597-99]
MGRSNKLSKKEERDIARDLKKTLEELENSEDALMFDGEPIDDHTKEMIRISLENSMRMAKQLAKQKFTPNKYKKD